MALTSPDWRLRRSGIITPRLCGKARRQTLGPYHAALFYIGGLIQRCLLVFLGVCGLQQRLGRCKFVAWVFRHQVPEKNALCSVAISHPGTLPRPIPGSSAGIPCFRLCPRMTVYFPVAVFGHLYRNEYRDACLLPLQEFRDVFLGGCLHLCTSRKNKRVKNKMYIF